MKNVRNASLMILHISNIIDPYFNSTVLIWEIFHGPHTGGTATHRSNLTATTILYGFFLHVAFRTWKKKASNAPKLTPQKTSKQGPNPSGLNNWAPQTSLPKDWPPAPGPLRWSNLEKWSQDVSGKPQLWQCLAWILVGPKNGQTKCGLRKRSKVRSQRLDGAVPESRAVHLPQRMPELPKISAEMKISDWTCRCCFFPYINVDRTGQIMLLFSSFTSQVEHVFLLHQHKNNMHQK